jgi:hypothetical protein
VINGFAGDELRFVADPGEPNQVTIAFDFGRDAPTVYDPGSVVAPGAGCSSIGPSWVSCPSGNPSVSAELGDGDDLLDLTQPLPLGHQVRVSGGPGNDVVRSPASSPPSTFAISGDDGNDEIHGGPYEDQLDGGAGDDRILAAGDGGEESTETVVCGPGTDSAEVDASDVVAADCESVDRRPVEAKEGEPAPPCVVPKLKGLTVKRARRRLAASGCRLGRVRRAHSRRVRKGRVIAQSRRPRARLARGARVGVTVSRGRRR